MFYFCCTLLYVHSSIAIILVGKRELIALLNLSSWCLVMVERLFLAVPRGCLLFVIVVFPDHTHLLILLHQQCRLFCHQDNMILQFGVLVIHFYTHKQGSLRGKPIILLIFALNCMYPCMYLLMWL